jgi:L-ascorbate metabolism protein UlaG (beta-lactamase superfamily)
MIRAAHSGRAFLEAVAVDSGERDTLSIWWLGQSGFLLSLGGSRVILDPYLSDSLTRKYEGTARPHIRMSELVIEPRELTGISLVTSSHAHTDHLDAETLSPLMLGNPEMQMVIPEANRALVAERLGCERMWPIGLDDGQEVDVAGWRLSGVAAAHNTIERDAEGRCLYLGFILRRHGWTIYHSGDTLMYPGLAKRLREAGPVDVAFLPINGNRPERGVAGNLDGREAAALAAEIGAGLVIPHHFWMFTFNTADPEEMFVPECERLGVAYRVLGMGERLEIDRSGLLGGAGETNVRA